MSENVRVQVRVRCPHMRCTEHHPLLVKNGISKHYRRHEIHPCCPRLKGWREGQGQSSDFMESDCKANVLPPGRQPRHHSPAPIPMDENDNQNLPPDPVAVATGATPSERPLPDQAVVEMVKAVRHDEAPLLSSELLTLMGLYTPKSLNTAVVPLHKRADALIHYMGVHFGALRLNAELVAAAAAVSLPAVAAHQPPMGLCIPFFYDTPALACTRRLWNGFGDVTSLIDVLRPWLQPLLLRAFDQNNRQEQPVAGSSIYHQCFVGMTMLPPCVATCGQQDFPSPWIIAHLRPSRQSPLFFAWSVVDDGRRMAQQFEKDLPNEMTFIKDAEETHSRYQEGVFMRSGEGACEHHIDPSEFVFDRWMVSPSKYAITLGDEREENGEGDSATIVPTIPAEPYLYVLLRFNLNETVEHSLANLQLLQPSTWSEWLLRYLDLDSKFPVLSPAAVSFILDGAFSVRNLCDGRLPLAMTIRLSQLGMTKEQIHLNYRLASVHHLSFAAFLRQSFPGDNFPEWLKKDQLDAAYHFFIRSRAATQLLPFRWMQEEELKKMWKRHVEWAGPALPFIAPNTTLVLYPIAATPDDPSFTALASILLNRPALFWEALQLRQLLSRSISASQTGGSRAAPMMLDLSYQDVPDSVVHIVGRLFGISFSVWAQQESHNKWFASHIHQPDAPSIGYLWRNIHGTLSAFCYATPVGEINFRARSDAPVHLSPPLLHHHHISLLHLHWKALVMYQLHPKLLGGGDAHFGAHGSQFATLYDVVASLFVKQGSLDRVALAVELRQVCAFIIRSQSQPNEECKRYKEWLAFHISHSADSATMWDLRQSAPSVLQLELSVLANLLGMEIEMRPTSDDLLAAGIADVVSCKPTIGNLSVRIVALWNHDSIAFSFSPSLK